MKYDDMKDVLNIYGYGAPAVVGIELVEYDKNIVYVKGSYDAMTVQLGVDVGKKFILERREYAPNLNTTLKKLVAMNTESKLFLVNKSFHETWFGMVAPPKKLILTPLFFSRSGTHRRPQQVGSRKSQVQQRRLSRVHSGFRQTVRHDHFSGPSLCESDQAAHEHHLGPTSKLFFLCLIFHAPLPKSLFFI